MAIETIGVGEYVIAVETTMVLYKLPAHMSTDQIAALIQPIDADELQLEIKVDNELQYEDNQILRDDEPEVRDMMLRDCCDWLTEHGCVVVEEL